jgi:hypothetical protein
MQDIFGISMSLGTVNNLRLEASLAVESAVEEAKIYVQNSLIVGADETSFAQGNVDGCNEKKSLAWLWVAVTPLVTYFQITLLASSQRWNFEALRVSTFSARNSPLTQILFTRGCRL